MLFNKIACAVALSSVVFAAPEPVPAPQKGGDAATETTLSPDAIQSGSFVDGSQQIGAAEVGQAKSLTSQNNFINNCVGKTLTNGLQIVTGSCNGIPMGDIPAKTSMISVSIIFPPTSNQAVVQSDTSFNITVQTSNLVAGSFTNADATYYAAPQFLQGGKVVGHTHVTVQDMGNSLNPKGTLDPTQFAFFKGINDAGNGQGLLTAVVAGGLPAGNYRVCTMTSASNHQPVLMPVAQRGTPDDCTKFIVGGNGKVENNAANDGSGGIAAAALAQSAVDAGAGAVDTATAAAAAATSVAAAKGGKGNNAGAASSAAAVAATSAAAAKAGKGNNAGGNANAASATTAAAAANTGNAGTKAGVAGGKGGAAAGGQQGGRTGGAGGRNGGGRKQRTRREFIA